LASGAPSRDLNYLGEATLTAAILDRPAMHAVRLHIDGPSYRQHAAEDRAAKRAADRTKRKANPPASRAPDIWRAR
jgi:hypothetical protein